MIHVIIRRDDNTYPDTGPESLAEAMLGCKFDNLSLISVVFKEEVTE